MSEGPDHNSDLTALDRRGVTVDHDLLHNVHEPLEYEHAAHDGWAPHLEMDANVDIL